MSARSSSISAIGASSASSASGFVLTSPSSFDDAPQNPASSTAASPHYDLLRTLVSHVRGVVREGLSHSFAGTEPEACSRPAE